LPRTNGFLLLLEAFCCRVVEQGTIGPGDRRELKYVERSVLKRKSYNIAESVERWCGRWNAFTADALGDDDLDST
jgi:hypothetical protein